MKTASRNYSQEERVLEAAKILTRWNQIKRPTISIEAQTYLDSYPFIPIIHTVHDQSGSPIYIIVDKEQAITALANMYDLHRKRDDGPLPH